MKKWIYELIYRFPFVPIEWIFGSSSGVENLVELATNGWIESGRVITLGCGVGRETIYLAKKGFDVIGVDFSSTAIKRARRKAQAEGVEANFLVDDLTNLQHVTGTFDLITDFGALNDMSQPARDLYMQNLLPLTHPDSSYLMFCFDNKLSADEVRGRFGEYFDIQVLDRKQGNRFPGSLTVYMMKRSPV